MLAMKILKIAIITGVVLLFLFMALAGVVYYTICACSPVEQPVVNSNNPARSAAPVSNR
jgi:cell division septal protein FtsQ